MLQREHSVILLTFIKLPIVSKTYVLSILSSRVLHKFYYYKHFLVDILIRLYEKRRTMFNENGKNDVKRKETDLLYIETIFFIP